MFEIFEVLRELICRTPPKNLGKPLRPFSLPRFYLSATEQLRCIHLQDRDLAADTPLIAGAGGTQLRRDLARSSFLGLPMDINIGDPQTRRFTGVYRFLFKMSGYF